MSTAQRQAKPTTTGRTGGPARDERYDEERVRELEEELERRRQGEVKRPDPKAFDQVPAAADPDARLDAIFDIVAARPDEHATDSTNAEGEALRDAIQADAELDRLQADADRLTRFVRKVDDFRVRHYPDGQDFHQALGLLSGLSTEARTALLEGISGTAPDVIDDLATGTPAALRVAHGPAHLSVLTAARHTDAIMTALYLGPKDAGLGGAGAEVSLALAVLPESDLARLARLEPDLWTAWMATLDPRDGERWARLAPPRFPSVPSVPSTNTKHDDEQTFTANPALAKQLHTVEDLLSYGVFDWAITDAEATRALGIVAGLDAASRKALVARLDRRGSFVDRLLDNVPPEVRWNQRDAFMSIVLARAVDKSVAFVKSLLTSGVSDEDARLAMSIVRALPERDRERLRHAEDGKYWRTLTSELDLADAAQADATFYDRQDESARMLAEVEAHLRDWPRPRLESHVAMLVAAGQRAELEALAHRHDLGHDADFAWLFASYGLERRGDKAAPAPFVAKSTWQEMGEAAREVAAGVRLGAAALGGLGGDVEQPTMDLDLADVATVMGGDIAGAELRTNDDEHEAELNHLVIKADRAAGHVQGDVAHLALARLAAFSGDTKISSGPVDLLGLHVEVHRGLRAKEDARIEARVDSLTATSLMRIAHDTMLRIGALELSRLIILARQPSRVGDDSRSLIALFTGAFETVISVLGDVPAELAHLLGTLDLRRPDSRALAAGLSHHFTATTGVDLQVGALTLHAVATSGGDYLDALELDGLSVTTSSHRKLDVMRQRLAQLEGHEADPATAKERAALTTELPKVELLTTRLDALTAKRERGTLSMREASERKRLLAELTVSEARVSLKSLRVEDLTLQTMSARALEVRDLDASVAGRTRSSTTPGDRGASAMRIGAAVQVDSARIDGSDDVAQRVEALEAERVEGVLDGDGTVGLAARGVEARGVSTGATSVAHLKIADVQATRRLERDPRTGDATLGTDFDVSARGVLAREVAHDDHSAERIGFDHAHAASKGETLEAAVDHVEAEGVASGTSKVGRVAVDGLAYANAGGQHQVAFANAKAEKVRASGTKADAIELDRGHVHAGPNGVRGGAKTASVKNVRGSGFALGAATGREVRVDANGRRVIVDAGSANVSNARVGTRKNGGEAKSLGARKAHAVLGASGAVTASAKHLSTRDGTVTLTEEGADGVTTRILHVDRAEMTNAKMTRTRSRLQAGADRIDGQGFVHEASGPGGATRVGGDLIIRDAKADLKNGVDEKTKVAKLESYEGSVGSVSAVDVDVQSYETSRPSSQANGKAVPESRMPESVSAQVSRLDVEGVRARGDANKTTIGVDRIAVDGEVDTRAMHRQVVGGRIEVDDAALTLGSGAVALSFGEIRGNRLRFEDTEHRVLAVADFFRLGSRDAKSSVSLESDGTRSAIDASVSVIELRQAELAIGTELTQIESASAGLTARNVDPRDLSRAGAELTVVNVRGTRILFDALHDIALVQTSEVDQLTADSFWLRGLGVGADGRGRYAAGVQGLEVSRATSSSGADAGGRLEGVRVDDAGVVVAPGDSSEVVATWANGVELAGGSFLVRSNDPKLAERRLVASEVVAMLARERDRVDREYVMSGGLLDYMQVHSDIVRGARRMIFGKVTPGEVHARMLVGELEVPVRANPGLHVQDAQALAHVDGSLQVSLRDGLSASVPIR
ncbi:MAG: hypothetical protein JNJ59_08020, partial [Deltaproteobacteria bacterium]|nr:hypothetical protein [Deltaproteobacteria bacterium]